MFTNVNVPAIRRHGSMSDRAIACTYALLEHKRMDAYVELLQTLEQHWNQLGVQPDPTVVVTDFESAAMQAIKQVFGRDDDTHGCFFHLTQATWRRLQSEGLASAYKTDEDFPFHQLSTTGNAIHSAGF